MVLVNSAQHWSMARPNYTTASTGTVMVPAVPMLEEETDDGQRLEGTSQAERIDIVAQDPLISVRRFVERVITVFPPETVPIQIGD